MNALLRRRAMMAAQKKPLLPPEYQQVEWIRPVANNSYIDLIDFGKVSVLALTGYRIVATVSDAQNGFSYSYGGINMIASFSTNACAYFGVYNNSMALGSTTQLGLDSISKRTYTYENNGMSATLSCDGMSVTRSRITNIESDTVLAIGGKYSGNAGIFKLFSMDLFKDNTKIAKYIPCYKKSNNAIGVYDTISNTFFASIGAFTKGADVN